jgi:hypothetical protein
VAAADSAGRRTRGTLLFRGRLPSAMGTRRRDGEGLVTGQIGAGGGNSMEKNEVAKAWIGSGADLERGN